MKEEVKEMKWGSKLMALALSLAVLIVSISATLKWH